MIVPKRKKTFLHFFPAPEFLLLSTSGVAVTDKAVRFTQFRRNSFSNKKHLSKWGRVALPVGAIESGFIRGTEEAKAALKALAQEYKLYFVRASLPDEKAYLFSAIIDKVPEENMRDAVAFIIEENVPISLQKAIFDFRTVELPDSSKVKVVVSVVHKRVIEAYSKIFEEAGMRVVSFDIESQAIARAIIPKGDTRTTLIVSVGEKKVSFYVVENEIVQFSTTPAQDLLASSSLNLRELKAEMQRVFAFWNSRVDAGYGGEKKITNILLCGSAVNDKNIIGELSADFPVEYNLVDPWVNASIPGMGGSILKESLEFVSAIGLALFRE